MFPVPQHTGTPQHPRWRRGWRTDHFAVRVPLLGDGHFPLAWSTLCECDCSRATCAGREHTARHVPSFVVITMVSPGCTLSGHAMRILSCVSLLTPGGIGIVDFGKRQLLVLYKWLFGLDLYMEINLKLLIQLYSCTTCTVQAL